MNKAFNSQRFIIVTLLILLAAATRALPLFVPDLWNFTAVGALAVFAGAQFNNKMLALIMPLAAMAVSDLFLGNGFSLLVYSAFIAMVGCGILIRRRKTIANITLASICGALIFFFVTNFAYFYPVTLYPHNAGGILLSYYRGLPFLNNMLAANLVYGFILFGSYYLLSRRYPALNTGN